MLLFLNKMMITITIDSTGYSALCSPPRLMRRIHTQRDSETARRQLSGGDGNDGDDDDYDDDCLTRTWYT